MLIETGDRDRGNRRYLADEETLYLYLYLYLYTLSCPTSH
jgi:hypothetical protein